MSSQSIGNIYNKLASSWDKKRGGRKCNSNVFNGTTTKEPLYHVASILERVFCDVHARNGIVDELVRVDPLHTMTCSSSHGVWIYDMRASDAAPKTQQDEKHLKAFVTAFIRKNFSAETQQYLLDHISISMCFFAWFFTTPNYFYATKEMRQTTRRGIEKIWTETLLRKKPKMMPQTSAKMPKSCGEMHQITMLVKMQDEKSALQTKIQQLINSEHPSHSIDWSEERVVHSTVSECFNMAGKCYIDGKKSKKLITLYNEYQKIADKITRAEAGIARAEKQQQFVSKNVSHTEEPIAEPPKKPVTEPEDEIPENWEDIAVEPEDEVPEEWEDIIV